MNQDVIGWKMQGHISVYSGFVHTLLFNKCCLATKIFFWVSSNQSSTCKFVVAKDEKHFLYDEIICPYSCKVFHPQADFKASHVLQLVALPVSNAPRLLAGRRNAYGLYST